MLLSWLRRLAAPQRSARTARLELEALEERALLSSDVILEWNAVLLQANATDSGLAAPQQGGPVLSARAFAIVSAAAYDAYNSVEQIGDPYLVMAPNATGADSDAAVAQAAHDALVALFPAQKATFDRALAATLRRTPDGRAETLGRQVGAAVARQILAARTGDGSSSIGTPAYQPNGEPGFHDVDPLHPQQGFYGTNAGDVTPFTIDNLEAFAAPALDDGTPEGRLAFLQSEAYTDAYDEILALGSDGVSAPTERTAEQTEIGIFWGYDGRPGLGTPPRLYNQIVRTIAMQEGNTEAENARLFALVNLAMADAGIVAWEDKYDNAFWRPVLGVRGGEDDGNPDTAGDADWVPLGAPASNPRPGETDFTPPFPAYTSGHATFGAATFQILSRFYGTDDISFRFTSDEFNGRTRDADGTIRPRVTRTFDSLTDAKVENAESRIYLGVHWRFDATGGIQTGDAVADYVYENFLGAAGRYRSIDGTGNNLANPEWGSAGQQLLRVAPAEYGDGVSTPAGADRPSAREISNLVSAHSDEATPNDRGTTAYIYIWGQFLDHDLDLTRTATPRESFPIDVPAGDPFFDPDGTGTQTLPFNRSVYDASTGTDASNPRQQLNQITAWIDGSMIYGSDATTATSLRTFTGGLLKTSDGDLPPTDAAGNFLAGDIRANENVELTSMHALFVREHNRLAAQYAAQDPSLTDEELYQKARATVIAEIQVVTYNEWLPALLGSNALDAYRGYDPTVNPGIANEFSTAAFRLHTTINDDVEFFDNDGRPVTFSYVNDAGETVTVEGEVALSDAFFNPDLLRGSGVDTILKYAASTHSEEFDTQIVDSLRNFLVTRPVGGVDLAALNIQRGRDHGLADYNTVRAAYGLPRVTSFAQITSDLDLQAALEEAYGTVDNIDLWVGAMAEDHVRGGSTGPLVKAILADQFERLRDGDRFWYQRVFSGRELAQLERTTLSDIIERNTGVEGLQEDVFFFKAEVRGQVFDDRNGDGAQGRSERGLAGVAVELVNDEGEVIATTRTGRDGTYRFDQFRETGDYQVRVVVPAGRAATTEATRDVLVSTGDQVVRGVDFGVRQLGAAPAGRERPEGGPAATRR